MNPTKCGNFRLSFHPPDGPWSMSHETIEAKIPRDIADPHEQWKYEMRREAQQIIPGLYLGPYQSSRLLEPLQRLGITHILVVYDQREKAFLKPRFPENFTYLVLEVRDATDQNVIGLFPQSVLYTVSDSYS